MIRINDLIYIAQCEAYHVNDDGTIDEDHRDPYFARRYNSNLDGKTPENISQYATGTTAKYTKYGRDIDNLTTLYNLPFYGYRVNGGDYCTTFTVWCFYQAALKYQRESGGVVSEGQAIAEAMVYCGLTKNDGQWFYKGLGTMPWVNDCILQYHEQQWLSHDNIVNGRDPQPGDIIFMGMGNEEPAHVGIVESINRGEGTIQTIEGNIGQYPMGVNPNASQKYKANICKVGNPNYRAVRSWNVGPNVDGYVVGVFHPNWGEDTVIPYPPSGIKLNHKTKVLTWSVQKASIKNTIIVVKPDGTSYGMKTDAYENQAGQRSFNFNTDQPHEGYTMEPGDLIKITSRIGTGEYSEPATTMVLKYTTPEGLIYDWTTSRLSWYGRSTETKWTVVKNGIPLATPTYNNYYEDHDVVPNETTFSVFIGGDDFAFESDRAATYIVGPRPEYPTLNDSLNKFKIILYEDDEEEFNSLGICDLTDAKACTVYEERNGEYYLELSYPMNEKSKQLKQRRIIYCKPNPFDDPEPFRIYSIKQNTKREVVVKAYHISYDLCGWVLLPSYQTLSYEGFLDRLNNTIPGECVLEDLSGGRSSKYHFRIISGYPTDSQALEKIHQTNIQNNGVDNIRSLLCGDDGLIKIYGGELMFKRWNIYHMERRGGLSTYTIRYGKNMKSLEATRAVDQSYEAVFPYYLWQDTNTDGENSAPKMVTIRSGTPVVPVREGVSVNAVDYSRILLYDVSGANIDGQNEMLPDGPSDEALVRLAREYINENHLQAKLSDGTCDFSIEIDNSLLNGKIQQNYPGIETARLCDDVSVYYPDADVTVIKKITKTEYDAIRNIYNRLEVTDGTEESNKIGSILSNNFSSSGSSTVTYEDVSKMIEKSKGGIVYFGYYNSANRMFYSDSSLVKQLPQSATSLYVDSFSGTLYTYSAGETGYRPVVDSGNSGLSENNFNTNDFTWDSGSLTLSIKDSKWATHSWVADYVVPNPSGNIGALLSKIKINDTIYGISATLSHVLTIKNNDQDLYSLIFDGVANRTIYADTGVVFNYHEVAAGEADSLKIGIDDTVFAKRSWVGTEITTALSSYYSKTDFNTSDFIENTQGKLSLKNKGYLNEDDFYDQDISRDSGGSGYETLMHINESKWAARTWVNGLLTDMATKTWVEDQDYCPTGDVETIVTEALTNYYTKGTINTKFGGYYAKTDFNTGDFIENSQGKLSIKSKGYVTEDNFWTDDIYLDSGELGLFQINANKWALKSDVKTYHAGNGMVLNASNYFSVDTGTIATRAWVQDNFVQKCLKAGTKIKMADGTDKNIEDVKPGDIVLSYDIQNDTTCEAVVLNMRQTGMAEAYTAMVFDNETYVEVYGEHDIYIDDRQRLECYQFMDSGEKAVTTDGTRTAFVFREMINHNAKSRHYAIVTSNHLYFANGILMGTRPNVTYEYASEIELPDNISTKLRAWAEYGKRPTEALLSPENLSAILELSKKSFTARSKMEALGKKLKDTDHVSIKRGEGEVDGVSEQVDLDKIRQRRAWRAEVRIHEQEYADAVAAIETYKQEHNIPNELSNREKLLYTNTEANAALNEFKEWAQSK